MVPDSPTVTNNPVEVVVLSVVVLSVVVLSVLVVLNELLDEEQDMEMKLKRNKEKIMSRFFTWFPNWFVLGEPNIYQNLVGFTRIGDFTWRVSDCEELSGGY